MEVRAARMAGHAAQEAYHRKMVDSAADCRAEGTEFLPLAVESPTMSDSTTRGLHGIGRV